MITKEHDLKAWPDMFEPMMNGDKPFDIRLNDRGFQKGDTVLLREWDPNLPERVGPGKYTGRECRKTISYVLSGWGLQPQYVVLGYKDMISSDVASEGAQYIGTRV